MPSQLRALRIMCLGAVGFVLGFHFSQRSAETFATPPAGIPTLPGTEPALGLSVSGLEKPSTSLAGGMVGMVAAGLAAAVALSAKSRSSRPWTQAHASQEHSLLCLISTRLQRVSQEMRVVTVWPVA
mmetsp:Transcript_49129/g.117012  ORF Transcript_49129/g.117012 Transcript_49129/m.117012 type:complete len:127 (+) Transcript_49129:57-437(+)